MGRVRVVPYALAAVFAALYAALGVLRYARMQATAFDLGIFTQAVRSYAELRAPTADLKGPGFPLLGDHFHPILATLAPAYAVLPSPVTLVVAQALLFAVSVIPVTRIGMHRLGTWPGALLGVAYALSFGIQQAMVFDFHEIAFAVPLLAFAAEALLRERWAAAMWWTLPLLLVKEDQAALVVAVGGYLALRGQWRRGAVLAGIGVAVGLLVLLVVIPAINPAGEYPYLGTADGGAANPLVRLFAPAAKWHLVYLLLLCVGFLALLSPLTLVAAVPLALRFWTEKPAYWAVGFHYNSVLMPLLFVAAVDGLARLAGWLRARPAVAPRVPWVTVAVAALVAGYAVVGTVRDQPLGLLLDPGQRRVSSTVVAAKRFLAATVPDGAVVAADNRIAPHLVSRCTVRMFPDAVDPRGNPLPVPRPPDTEWIAVREPPGSFPLDPAAYRAYVATLPARGYTLVGTEAGISVYRRAAPPAGGVSG
ncbi:hypothetical protein GCM10010124_07840 [Pilimelia terevasa]|uniref:DUF2079 domain-containing protein n=1 Tax=Pilimelia terevasa TaxID=53372 RepID=A0A8J3BIY8_9ACTN|nr:DUF2079 domain-containing protein [Pilimelia terevasa]GGK17725.1 hypothetical protein GCM10010124_07840 [Pilimelia terevasa]